MTAPTESDTAFVAEKHIVAEIFNPARVERHIHCNEHRAVAVFDVVRDILIKGTEPITETRAAIKRRQLFQAVHRLENFKACLHNLGGERCCELAEEIIELLEQERHQPIVATMLDYMERELNTFLEYAQRWLKEAETEFNHTLTNRIDKTQTQLDALYHALVSSNFLACDLFLQLSHYLQTTLSDADYLNLEQAMDYLHFSEASVYIEPLITAKNTVS